MNVNKIASKITIRPTNKKMKQAKQFIENSGLPKEMPVEKKIYYRSEADCFDKDVYKRQVQACIFQTPHQA